jgi:ABC-2 type transport system ATP-binding protein
VAADVDSLGEQTTSDDSSSAQDTASPEVKAAPKTGSKAAAKTPAKSSAKPAAKRPATRARKAAAPVQTSTQKASARAQAIVNNPILLETRGLTKHYDETVAADSVTISVREGSFFGVVGPNGAGKTTVLSMISGLNRPTSGDVMVAGQSVWQNPTAAKPLIGMLPDKLRLFDRLTGSQLLFYAGILYGLDDSVVTDRSKKLAHAFGLESALNRPVTDYSAGMQKKIALATAMIHAPRVLVLDEPFEAIDPVSAATLTELLEKFVQAGGSVILSSHSMEMIQRTCDHVAVIAEGKVIAQGTVDDVRAGKSLSERFESLTQGGESQGAMEWLFRSSGSE